MNLEELIYSRLKSNESLAGSLSEYSGAPAIFYQEAPNDAQPGWDGRPNYPRIVYDLDTQADTERKSSGTLAVAVMCERFVGTPEDIEDAVRSSLRDLIVKPDGESPYCFAWARSDPFSLDSTEKRKQVVGIEIRFDILELPYQETTDPDPIVALNLYVHELFPEGKVIGLTELDGLTEATKNAPVFYCRLVSVETESITNTVVWMNARIAVHIVCPDSAARMKISMYLLNSISTEGSLTMLDRSPMNVMRVSTDNTTDYLRTGQISGTFHYGVLRWGRQPHVITNVNLSIQKEDQDG